MALQRLDAALRRRSIVAWITFRAVTGTFAVFGLYLWIALWFERGFWLGVTQATVCVLVLAHELGILPRSSLG